MAGDTRLIMGDSEGTGVSPTAGGKAAMTGAALPANATRATNGRTVRFMGNSADGRCDFKHPCAESAARAPQNERKSAKQKERTCVRSFML
jgi:hypothetical protein